MIAFTKSEKLDAYTWRLYVLHDGIMHDDFIRDDIDQNEADAMSIMMAVKICNNRKDGLMILNDNLKVVETFKYKSFGNRKISKFASLFHAYNSFGSRNITIHYSHSEKWEISKVFLEYADKNIWENELPTKETS